MANQRADCHWSRQRITQKGRQYAASRSQTRKAGTSEHSGIAFEKFAPRVRRSASGRDTSHPQADMERQPDFILSGTYFPRTRYGRSQHAHGGIRTGRGGQLFNTTHGGIPGPVAWDGLGPPAKQHGGELSRDRRKDRKNRHRAGPGVLFGTAARNNFALKGPAVQGPPTSENYTQTKGRVWVRRTA